MWTPWSRRTRLQPGRNDRTALLGPNGSGKTTLVRALLAGALVERKNLFVLPQDIDEARARDAVRGLPREDRGRVLSRVAALGAQSDQLLATRSPRERALAVYDGPLLLIAHNETLARSCTERLWRLQHDRLEVHAWGKPPR